MGTIAARDCLRVLELTEQVVAALLVTVRQGMMLRMKLNPDAKTNLGIMPMYEALSQEIDAIGEDRRLEPDLHRLTTLIQEQAWDCYQEGTK